MSFGDGYCFGRRGRLVLDGESDEFVAGYQEYAKTHCYLDDNMVGFDQEPRLGPRVCFLDGPLHSLDSGAVELGSGISVIYNTRLVRLTIINGQRTLYLDRVLTHAFLRSEYRIVFGTSIIRVWI